MANWQVKKYLRENSSSVLKKVISVMTQACHAATAILHMTREDEQTKEYLNDLDNMHKVVLEVSKPIQICQRI